MMTDTTEVERFEPWEVPAAYRHDIWVRATDYDALAAKLAEVTAERDKAKEDNRWAYIAGAFDETGISDDALPAAYGCLPSSRPYTKRREGMTDWCPENDGAYRAEMAAMYPVQNRKRIDELEAALRKCVGALGDISNGEPEWPNDPQKELDWCRNRATNALSALEEYKLDEPLHRHTWNPPTNFGSKEE